MRPTQTKPLLLFFACAFSHHILQFLAFALILSLAVLLNPFPLCSSQLSKTIGGALVAGNWAMLSMTASRLGNIDLALKSLLMDVNVSSTKGGPAARNILCYLPSGQNHPNT
eukprot:COSAG04_NODE_1056_length_8541_cov_4.364369_10_plen_112_part_00